MKISTKILNYTIQNGSDWKRIIVLDRVAHMNKAS